MNDRICICCGQKYEYCPHCGESRNKPRWLMNYDDEGCHIAFQTVTDYLMGEVTKEAAKVILEGTPLKNRQMFKPSVAKYVDEILDGKIAENKVDYTEQNKKEAEAKVEVKAEIKVEEPKAEEVKEVKTEVKANYVAPAEKKDDNKKNYQKQQHDKFTKFEKSYNK